MNLIVGLKKSQVEVQKDEFGSRKKNIKSEIQKMNLIVRKRNCELKFKNSLIWVEFEFHPNFIVFMHLGFCERNVT